MFTQIKVKTLFSGWQVVNKPTALSLARRLYAGITAMKAEEKLTYINQHFKGIQFTHEELRAKPKWEE